MRKKLLPLITTLSAVVFAFETASAAIVFDENFDSSPYHDNTKFDENNPGAGITPVTGSNKLAHGAWGISLKGTGSVSASTAQSLSANRSVALTVNSSGDQSQIIGAFGLTGAQNTPVTDGLVLTFSFQLTDMSKNTYILIRDGSDKNLGYVILGAGSTAAQGYVTAQFADGMRTNISTVSANTWYTLQLTMPQNPSASANVYSVSLFAADGTTQIGSTASGAFPVATAANNYSYFTFYNQGYAGQSTPMTAYFDNIKAETIPEPGYIAVSLLGTCALLFRRRRTTPLA